ncbi:MAG: PmoA family protein [Opitutaceae bacterium]
MPLPAEDSGNVPEIGLDAGDGLAMTEQDGVVTVKIGGRLFTRYRPDLAARPFFFPILLDGRIPLTRGWPVDPGPDDEEDHRHHRGLWFTHGSVNGLDFWTEGKGPRIVQESLELGEDGFRTVDSWRDAESNPVCRDIRNHRFRLLENGVLLDIEVELFAGEAPLILGDTKEGTMAIRVAPSMRVKGPVAQGTIETSTGLKDGAAWGKRSAWVDYSGPVEGEWVGVAIFDHPDNPRHPTWWHVRDYGLFAANPFGVHDFENAPPGTGDLSIPAGGSVRFRYRFFFHHGDSESAGVAAQYSLYTESIHENP